MDRIVFFSDAVIAIAITLLAIDLRLPETASGQSPATLLAQLRALGPQFISFAISFFVIGIYWMSHHRYFRLVRRYDIGLVALNLLFLLCIVLMPFVADLFGRYYEDPLAISIYAAAVAATGASLGAVWWYAAYHHRLIDRDLDEGFIRSRSVAQAVPLLFLVSIPFAYVNRALAIGIWCALPPASYLLTRRLGREQNQG